MSDLVKLYNPANSASLTPQQITDLQKLSSAEIKELALAYPNLSMARAYLLIIDGSKPAEKQLPTLSSFENLYNLRAKNGLKNFVAYGFRGQLKATPSLNIRSKKPEVLDLSETELLSLPGFKVKNSAPAQFGQISPADDHIKVSEPKKVNVKKIKKIPIAETKK